MMIRIALRFALAAEAANMFGSVGNRLRHQYAVVPVWDGKRRRYVPKAVPLISGNHLKRSLKDVFVEKAKAAGLPVLKWHQNGVYLTFPPWDQFREMYGGEGWFGELQDKVERGSPTLETLREIDRIIIENDVVADVFGYLLPVEKRARSAKGALSPKREGRVYVTNALPAADAVDAAALFTVARARHSPVVPEVQGEKGRTQEIIPREHGSAVYVVKLGIWLDGIGVPQYGGDPLKDAEERRRALLGAVADWLANWRFGANRTNSEVDPRPLAAVLAVGDGFVNLPSLSGRWHAELCAGRYGRLVAYVAEEEQERLGGPPKCAELVDTFRKFAAAVETAGREGSKGEEGGTEGGAGP